MAVGSVSPALGDLGLGRGGLCAFFPDDLRAQIQKYFVHVCPPPSAGLVVGLLAPGLGELEGSGPGDHAVVLHIGLVTHDDKGDVFVIFDAHDLFAELGELVEGVGVADGKDQEEALSLFHVQLAHGGKLFGAGCVESMLGLAQHSRMGTTGTAYISSMTCRPSTLTCFRYESSMVGS
jgi:hypothetical protein